MGLDYSLLDLLGNRVVRNCCQLTYKYRETATSAIDSRSWGDRVLLVQVSQISQNTRGLLKSSIGHVLQAVQRGQHHCIGHVLQAVQRGQHHWTLFLFPSYFFTREFEHFYSVEEKQACEAWKELILCICISKRSLLLEPDMATLRWKAKTSQSNTSMVESSNCTIAYTWWQCWRQRPDLRRTTSHVLSASPMVHSTDNSAGSPSECNDT